MKMTNDQNFMDIVDALQIVLDLAKQANEKFAASPADYARQNTAIGVVEDMAVNQFGDD
jgi:hypothetical protein